MTFSQAHDIALEHVSWARAHGLSIDDVFAQASAKAAPSDGWDDAVAVIEHVVLRMNADD